MKLSMLPFMVKAAVCDAEEIPEFNASLDGDTLIYKNHWHIGFAADTPNGLMVPGHPRRRQEDDPEIAIEMKPARQARARGQIKPDQMQGGCFSISSLGGIGGIYFTPIINAPEVAIMGVSSYGTAGDQDGGKTCRPGLTLPLSLVGPSRHRRRGGARFNV